MAAWRLTLIGHIFPPQYPGYKATSTTEVDISLVVTMEVGGDNLVNNSGEFVAVNYNIVNNNIVNNNMMNNNIVNNNMVNNHNLNSNYKMVNNKNRTYRVVNTKPYLGIDKNNRSLMNNINQDNNIYQDNYTGYEDMNNRTTGPYKTVNNTAKSMDGVYNTLRKQVPTFPNEKRLSKIDTLKLTIAYINLLKNILESEMEPVKYIQQGLEDCKERDLMWKTSDLTARLHWVDWARIGEGGRRGDTG